MYKHILVAVAFNENDEPNKPIAAAQALADAGARVTVLHVKAAVPSYAISYMPQDYLDELNTAIRGKIEEIAQKFENGAGVLIEGHSGRTIVEWAKENAVDCIIIASHRPGLQDYFIGSTAARVVRYAQCSVHVVR
ncbi:universal stress protein [Profundibacter sp.]